MISASLIHVLFLFIIITTTVDTGTSLTDCYSNITSTCASLNEACLFEADGITGDGSCEDGGGGGGLLEWLLTAVAGLAAFGIVTLITVRSDDVRRHIMSHEKLAAERHAHYQADWQWLLGERCALQISYARVGGSISSYDRSQELAQICFLDTKSKIRAFIENAVLLQRGTRAASVLPPLQVGRVGPDFRSASSPKAVEALMQHVRLEQCFVWIYRDANVDAGVESEIYQAPLVLFAQAAADVLEMKGNASAIKLSFVADASANLASNLVVSLVRASTMPVQIIQQPLWMACVAWLAEQDSVSPSSKKTRLTLERAVFALCRLQSLETARTDANAAELCNRRSENGATERRNSTTILFTLPGQACTAALLPLLVAAFPNERHIFAYAGCLETVAHARHAAFVRQRQTYSLAGCDLPKKLSDALCLSDSTTDEHGKVQSFSSPTTPWTTPLPRARRDMEQSVWIRDASRLRAALAALSSHDARVLEAWMTSVHTWLYAQSIAASPRSSLLTNKNPLVAYRPFVFRSQDVTNPIMRPVLVPQLSQGIDEPRLEVSFQCEGYRATRSLLQFITDLQPQELTTEIMDAAMNVLDTKDSSQWDKSGLPASVERAINNVMHQHDLLRTRKVKKDVK